MLLDYGLADSLSAIQSGLCGASPQRSFNTLRIQQVAANQQLLLAPYSELLHGKYAEILE